VLEKPFEKTKNDLVQYCRQIEDENRQLKVQVRVLQEILIGQKATTKEVDYDCDCSGE
jgi:HPt (histidine-containing phosphotransfer) domain-containing protein